MTQVATTATAAGSARVQGDLWSVRAGDYAEIQEPTFLPLYQDVLVRPELANAGALLDVGCGPGLAAQTFARKIGTVAGVDASAPFIEIAQARVPGGDFRVAEMEALPHGIMASTPRPASMRSNTRPRRCRHCARRGAS